MGLFENVGVGLETHVEYFSHDERLTPLVKKLNIIYRKYTCKMGTDIFEGLYQRFNHDQTISEEVNYHNGKEHGEHIWYYYKRYDNIVKQVDTYKDGISHGLSYEEYDNGVRKYEISFDNGIKHGDYITRAYDGKIISHTKFVHGKPTDEELYFADSNILHEKHRRNNDIDEVTIYYKNGQIHEHYYEKDNVYHGNYKKYRSDGLLLFNADYENGKKNGIYESFYNNGEPFVKARYINDTPIGMYLKYDKDKKIIQKINYIINGK